MLYSTLSQVFSCMEVSLVFLITASDLLVWLLWFQNWNLNNPFPEVINDHGTDGSFMDLSGDSLIKSLYVWTSWTFGDFARNCRLNVLPCQCPVYEKSSHLATSPSLLKWKLLWLFIDVRKRRNEKLWKSSAREILG